VEDYLKELLSDSPLARIKLLAAWDGLTTETQITLLSALASRYGGREEERRHGGSQADRVIWLKALSSANEYVRYLAARALDLNEFGKSEEQKQADREILARIAADTSPLVRYARGGDWPGLIGEWPAQVFDRYPKEKKLATVAGRWEEPPYGRPPSGAALASWLSHAIENKTTSEDELLDVVREWVRNPEAMNDLRSTTYDFFGDKELAEGVKALWLLLPKVPREVGFELVRSLPWHSPLFHEPPEELVKWLETSDYLCALLCREDVPLWELRRKVFFSAEPYHSANKFGAVRHHFTLSFDELHTLFKEQSKLLEELQFSESLEPVMLRALADCPHLEYWTDKHFERKFEEALKKLDGQKRAAELRLLRIYYLAKTVRPWDSEQEVNLNPLEGPLEALTGKVVKDDTWGTFLEFEQAIGSALERWRVPHLEWLETPEEMKADEAAQPPRHAALTPHEGTPNGENGREASAAIEARVRPWMLAAYSVFGIGAVAFVSLPTNSPLRLELSITSLATTACILWLVSNRYPESKQGNEFRVAVSFACGIAATGAVLWSFGLIDPFERVANTLARQATAWEGGWGEWFISWIIDFLPVLPVVMFFGYLFNADARLS
jgi:hypothetical protein